jgi:hypothetical protein
MKSTLISILLATFIFLLTGCENDNITPPGTWLNHVFIVNEGPFFNGTGSISAFNRGNLWVSNNIFESVNGRPLGNIVQSMSIYQDKAFIVVNNANKIEVVSLEDFKSDTTIENLTLPRYFIAFNNQKGYVSCWDSTVKVINMGDYSVTASIQTGNGPDKMLLVGNRLFVLNTGGYGTDSTVSVIRTDDEEVISLIKVGDRPSGIQEDASGKIWVLCSGKGWPGTPAPGDTKGKLVCLDPDSFQILKELSFPDTEDHPENLVIDKDGLTLYYNHPAGIFAYSIFDSTLNALPFITHNAKFYGIGYDKVSEMIMATDPLDYSQNGWVFRYNGADGSPVDSFQVGTIPNGFCFN